MDSNLEILQEASINIFGFSTTKKMVFENENLDKLV